MVNHRLIQLMWNLSEQLIIWPSSVSESYRWAILEESWTICETWLGSWYYLVLPIVTRTLAEHKIREEAVRKDKKKATVCGPWMQKHSLLGGVFLLPLHCTCCHFHSRQRRWNWFTVTCASQMERLISLKLNWLGVTLWQLSVPFNFFFFWAVYIITEEYKTGMKILSNSALAKTVLYIYRLECAPGCPERENIR